jgi:hypothetical protein
MATSRSSRMWLGLGNVSRDPQTLSAWPGLPCVVLHVPLVPHNLVGRCRYFLPLDDFIIAHYRYPLLRDLLRRPAKVCILADPRCYQQFVFLGIVDIRTLTRKAGLDRHLHDARINRG